MLCLLIIKQNGRIKCQVTSAYYVHIKCLNIQCSYETEAYIKCHVMSRTRRSALAKFRCGVAPLRIETGRYEMIPYEERYCFNCTNKIESEEHVLLECPLYNDIRLELLSKIDLQHFDSLDNHEKACHLLSDGRIAIYSAKACQIILTERRNFLYR